MKPTAADLYLGDLQGISKSFVEKIKRESSSWPNGITPGDFLDTAFIFALEANARIALDTFLGAFEVNPDPEILKLIDANLKFKLSIEETIMKRNLLARFVPHLLKEYRDMQRNGSIVVDFVQVRL